MHLHTGLPRRAEPLDHHVHAHAIIKRLPGDQISHLGELADARGDVTGAHERLGTLTIHAQVDGQVLDLRGTCAGGLVHEVHGGGAHDPNQILAALHQYPLIYEGLGIPSTERDELREAAIVYMRDHEADLIHMGGKHESACGCIGRSAHAVDAPHGVGVHAVGEAGQLLQNDGPHPVLVPRRARGVRKGTQQHHVHQLRAVLPPADPSRGCVNGSEMAQSAMLAAIRVMMPGMNQMPPQARKPAQPPR